MAYTSLKNLCRSQDCLDLSHMGVAQPPFIISGRNGLQATSESPDMWFRWNTDKHLQNELSQDIIIPSHLLFLGLSRSRMSTHLVLTTL